MDCRLRALVRAVWILQFAGGAPGGMADGLICDTTCGWVVCQTGWCATGKTWARGGCP